MARSRIATAVSTLPARVSTAVQVRSVPATDGERGDVPGWVLVTLMSALIVVGLIATLQTQLGNAFTRALNSVSTP